MKVQSVVLPKRIVVGLLEGDAMANEHFAADMVAYHVLRAASAADDGRKQTVVLVAEEKVLKHIADYIDRLCDMDSATKERFGFTRADAREAHELLVFQLDK